MNDLINALIQPKTGKHLGDLCGWSLSGLHPVKTVDDLVERLGLSDDFVFPKKSAVGAYRRAVSEACKDAARSDERGWSGEMVEAHGEHLVHELVRKQVTIGGESSLTDKTTQFESETRVRFNKITETVECEHAAHPMALRVADLYHKYLEVYSTSEIRTAFQSAFYRWEGVRVLEHGGLWLIPAIYAEKVRLWKEFISELKCTSFIVPVLDSDEALASMQVAAETSLEGRLTELIGELEYFASCDTVRLSTLESRLDSFDHLRSKTEIYERLLGNKMDDLKNRLDTAANSLRSSLSVFDND